MWHRSYLPIYSAGKMKTLRIEDQIKEGITLAFNQLFKAEVKSEEIKLQPTNKEFEGDFTFVVFAFLKETKKSPEESGKMIGEFIMNHTGLIDSYNVVKGFLNLVISGEVWISTLKNIENNDQHGFKQRNGTQVMVEYSSPNTNKPLHLGHLRNNFLGYSVAKILEANGNTVHKVQIINDRGIHICKSMLAWIKFGKGETPESAGMKGDKFVGKYYVKFDQIYREEVRQLMADGILKEDAEKEASIMKEAQELLKKWEDKDTEAYSLWEKMNHWVYDGFEKTYKTMGVEFDRLYYESETYLEGKNEVLKGVESGNFTRKEDGSVWVDLTDEGLDEKLLLRKDGTSVYITQDIGTAMMRFRDYPGLSRIIYTVGNEQDYHFKVLFLILKKLGVEWYKGLYHLSYGMVDLPTGRMKSREGTVVDADDLMEEMIITAEKHTRELGKIEGFEEEQAKDLYRILGLGALKYFLLRIDPRKRMQFDPEESIEFQGNTGPFIQYTHARIASILRKAAELNFDPRGSFSMTEINRYERDVLFLINDFENRIDEAAKELSPSLIAQYVYEIAKEYNKFYSEISIFNEKDPEKIKARVQLSYITSRTIKAAMLLLGIEVPDRM